MFQRISRLLFGEVEDTSKDLKGPKPSVLEAEEEGWLLVSITESNPLDDIFIDLPGLSVYGSHGDQAATEEVVASLVSLTSSVRMVEPPLPTARSGMPRPGLRNLAPRAGAMTVTQVGRMQRDWAHADHRLLARNRRQRQNAARDRLPRRVGHTHRPILHQPGLRACNH
ncbi:hypothetical protein AAFF_G00145070 [Aldrovandia affinis]|uniref:Uncharacterized protein n=1 Tax=Aldrovandia affinis TaxID=143900 RepID=A0AAD7T0Z3_9TELE|nr:hypothetical protein AAFF_G00145070 [Aldrovandia affinis]